MQSLTFRAMSTQVLLAARDCPASTAGLEKAREFVNDAEQRFSRFLPDSELSRLNGLAGGWLSVSAEMMEVLELSKRYFESTQGLFDPTILNDLIHAGYDRTIDAIRTAGTASASSFANQAQSPQIRESLGRKWRSSLADLELDLAQRRVRMPADMAIDLGGIAKGWIVQKAATLLSSFASPCAAGAGGDFFFVGTPEDGSKWSVEVEDPEDPGRTIARLSTGPGAVVTSSVTKRRWSHNGQIVHHIIDPRSGRPAETPWLSATVVADGAPAAEAYAKALLIGGRPQAAEYSATRTDLAFILIDTDRRVYASENGKELIHDGLSINSFD